MSQGRIAAALCLSIAALSVGQPASAGRIIDDTLSVKFTPPPYFQSSKLPEGSPIHYAMVPPEKDVTIRTGGKFERKLDKMPPFTATMAKSFCGRASEFIGKDMVLKQSARYLLDNVNGVECQFAGASGRTIHWVAVPVPAQLIFFYAEWPKSPSTEQVSVFRRFVGGVQIF